jgi:hypothetical protein
VDQEDLPVDGGRVRHAAEATGEANDGRQDLSDAAVAAPAGHAQRDADGLCAGGVRGESV